MIGSLPPPRISVALCTHNGEAFIEQQLLSILSQDPAPWEVVVSDDASKDGTVAIVERAVADWNSSLPTPIELVMLRNATPLGVTANFEQAIAACGGDLIALSDQDDVWHPGRLARVLDILAERPTVRVVASDATLVDREGVRLGYSLFEALEVTERDLALVNGQQPFATLMRRNIITGATMVFRRDVLDVAMPFPSSWVHDEWIATMGAALGDVVLVEDQLIDYRQHGGNQIGALRLSLPDKVRRLFEPRADRNARLLVRAEALAERTAFHTELLSPRVRETAAAKLAHERARSALPTMRVRRLIPVLAAGVAGRYGTFGRGAMDMVRDICQPSG
ncbi:glycosyltransferase family 2 protein [Demequina lutea]|uniref:Glycosyltransferase involved in cell wall biosynthesis n=1 Tax=Demequina lutea TaxID=431489 RepID=A0A7Y9ZFJ9_9MICO|nr:glycosyltransferase family 2 protein [Demequina lutea]NYI42461.1 glycosyltransferase involved in cell wall biosynthesis [Demequina lutea]